MNTVILLGAGFSRNWGGWLATEAFEYLIGCPEIVSCSRLRQLLWEHQSAGGFEDALAEVQRDYRQDPGKHSAILQAFQSAIGRMFDEMNRGYATYAGLEFQQHRQFMVRTFLVQFEAIFSLNQDLLLEQHYLNDNVMLGSDGHWSGGWQIPGLSLKPDSLVPLQPRATGIWVPSGSVATSPRCQPLYKLHGSSNWRDSTNNALMIIGGDKAQQIRTHSLLNEYALTFEARLSKPDTRLMIIGYGFRDHHINKVISRAVYESGLKFFVICPEGIDVAKTFRSSAQPGAALTAFGYDLEDVFARGLEGASRRSLRETFGSDQIEHAKVMRFLQPTTGN